MSRAFRTHVWHLVEAGSGEDSDRFDWFDWFIAALIVLNVAAFVLETEPAIRQPLAPTFHVFEVFSLIVFGIEYVLRIWSCTADPRYRQPVRGRLHYATRPLTLIDLIALTPAVLFFLPDLRVVRVLRLLRLLRVVKLGRYSEAVALLGRVVKSRRAELAVMLLMLLVLLILAASALHYAEGDIQPDGFGTIPRAMWWAVVTLTTIGYGDVYPITAIGKVFGGIIAVSGIGIVALPTAIIASGFSEELHKAHARRTRRRVAKAAAEAERNAEETGSDLLLCPHCGEPIRAKLETRT